MVPWPNLYKLPFNNTYYNNKSNKRRRLLQQEQAVCKGGTNSWPNCLWIDTVKPIRKLVVTLDCCLPCYPPDTNSVLQQVSFKKQQRVVSSAASSSSEQQEEEERKVSVEDLLPIAVDNPPPRILCTDLIALLPPEYECVQQQSANGGGYTIYPPLSLYEVGIDNEFG